MEDEERHSDYSPHKKNFDIINLLEFIFANPQGNEIFPKLSWSFIILTKISFLSTSPLKFEGVKGKVNFVLACHL